MVEEIKKCNFKEIYPDKNGKPESYCLVSRFPITPKKIDRIMCLGEDVCILFQMYRMLYKMQGKR